MMFLSSSLSSPSPKHNNNIENHHPFFCIISNRRASSSSTSRQKRRRNQILFLVVFVLFGFVIIQYWNLHNYYFLTSTTTTTTTTSYSGIILPRRQQQQQQRGNSKETRRIGITFRTRYPFSIPFLQKIYKISQELYYEKQQQQEPNYNYHNFATKYDLIVLVDTTSMPKTKATNSTPPQEILKRYYYDQQQHRSDNITNTSRKNSISSIIPPNIPKSFEVNEDIVLKEYPKLSNYLYNNNSDDLNFNNKPGFCCGNSLMWQLLIPTFVLMFVHYGKDNNYLYEYMWCIEDDIDTIGSNSLLETIIKWDISMKNLQQQEQEPSILSSSLHQPTQPMIVDAAAISLLGFGKLQKGSSRQLHTKSFHNIIQRMNTIRKQRHHRLETAQNKDDTTSQNIFSPTSSPYILDYNHVPTTWTSMSDSIHRYSQKFAVYLHKQISNNVFSWCETFLHPIAWSGNYTIVDLRNLPLFDDEEEELEIYMINQHKNPKDVLQYYNNTISTSYMSSSSSSLTTNNKTKVMIDNNNNGNNHTTSGSSGKKIKKKGRKTILYHGPSLDRAHQYY